MKQYSVIFSPEALDQLTELYHYIAVAASPEVRATHFFCSATGEVALIYYCEAK